ncbi:hypothetical protein N7448_008516 [Penicillium atrosanguineum]|uniref:Uncharacterized protein n=1 Tax=Penicillium atrosanguineum TaxID=1132637 RepID=A0A9W9GRC4_9EURO|nr:uncharacterized protein N7443_000469 [Penicillium atrosanguineum]KAJ5127737.1 hypothetical protein N7448_008516 [Penicillium atrosanguineum]KAJ5147946.1 hypothetical protein N7526_001298 [Penicillium atrosanguineum]KAJ5313585.1 hypothetical protein N7443_000469 [Penicillium atrosanguineum]KAJ5330759.1 hypothetical protein N7476_000542 [Penicillium atrosanguineum]
MEPASMALAVVGTLDLCISYGNKLVKFCHEQRSLEYDIGEIALNIEGVWLKTKVQLTSLERLWGSLAPALQIHYADAVQRLHIKISGAVDGFASVYLRNKFAKSVPQKAKIVYLKRHLQQVVKDLEDWQQRFDPSWYLITRLAEPKVDRELENPAARQNPSATRLFEMRGAIQQSLSKRNECSGSVFVSLGMIETNPERIPGTNDYLSRYSTGARRVLLSSTTFAGTAIAARKSNVRDLARLLRHVDSMSFGLLRCEGVLERHTDLDTQFQFIFEIPEGLDSPKTIRTLLTEKPECSLSKRVQLAKQLTRSVMFVHTTGFVHKGIRPETIVVFSQNGQDMGPSFLIGFEQVRRAEAQTSFLGDLQWERNLYRHPVRQGLWSEEAFTMQHDIYSLGVCLLEIALWRSFVELEGDAATPWSDLRIGTAICEKDARRGGFAIKKQLTMLAKARLPALVGDRYTDIVLACLGCLDKNEDNVFDMQGIDTRDEDGIIIGVRYIENVLLKIEELLV